MARLDQILRSAAAGIPEAQFELGKRYLLGENGSRDLDKAHHWMKMAKSSGIKAAGPALLAIKKLKRGASKPRFPAATAAH